MGHPWDAPLCHNNTSWGMQYVQNIHFACCGGIKGANGRNTIKGGHKAFQIAWPNIVHQIEDEASSESDKKVEWYSDHHNNLTDDIRLAEEKASTKWDHHRKADKKLAQANSRITDLEAKLMGLQRELAVLQKQDKRTPINQGDLFNFSDSESEAMSSRSSWKRKKGQAFPPSTSYEASSLTRLVCQYRLMSRCQWYWHQHHHQQWGLRPHHL